MDVQIKRVRERLGLEMTARQSSVYRLVKAKTVSETIQKEHVVGSKEQPKDETLENINVKLREKPAKVNLNVWLYGSQRGGV